MLKCIAVSFTQWERKGWQDVSYNCFDIGKSILTLCLLLISFFSKNELIIIVNFTFFFL